MYFPSITHIDHGTYTRVFKDADVCVSRWYNVPVEKTGEPRETHGIWTSDHYQNAIQAPKWYLAFQKIFFLLCKNAELSVLF